MYWHMARSVYNENFLCRKINGSLKSLLILFDKSAAKTIKITLLNTKNRKFSLRVFTVFYSNLIIICDQSNYLERFEKWWFSVFDHLENAQIPDNFFGCEYLNDKGNRRSHKRTLWWSLLGPKRLRHSKFRYIMVI